MWPRPQLRERIRVVAWAVERSAFLAARSVPAAFVVVVVLGMGLPSSAAAHGPVDPAASSYLATVTQEPAGVEAKVIDGDQRMWIRVDPAETVVVLDYRGAPYLRFSPTGVEVNHNSTMYYLNAVPAELPPSDLRVSTQPRWQPVSAGHEYGWHEGRLHALAAIALAPGVTYVGQWTVPLSVDGRRGAIVGALHYSPNPPVVWFWPILVALACVLAGLRLNRPALDLRLARAISLAALVSLTVLAVGQQLHGRPTVSPVNIVGLVAVIAFDGWALRRLLLRRAGWFTLFLITGAAFWQGLTVVSVLARGFVLLALPATVARIATVTCLACGASLLPVVLRIADQARERGGEDVVDEEFDWDHDEMLEQEV